MESVLNQNDLVELGYKPEAFDKHPLSTNKLYYIKENSEWGITVRFNFYQDKHPNVHIYKVRGDKFDTFFAGKIKNKTELSKALEQVTA